MKTKIFVGLYDVAHQSFLVYAVLTIDRASFQ